MKRKGEEAEEVEKKKLKKNKKVKKKENSQPTEKGDNVESSFTSPEKKKKKKKAEKEKVKKQKKESESSQENSHEEDKNTGSSQEEDAASTCWFEDDIEALLESLENMEEHADFVCNKVPPEVWSSLRVGNHSPESCHKIWNKICQVVKTHLTIHHVLMIMKDMMHSKKIMKLLVSKIPGAPTVKIISGYQCFTKERLAETPPRSFKDIGAEWKALSDSERSRYQEKADKANKETIKKQEEFLQSLSEEMKEKYLEQTKRIGQKQPSKSKSQKEFADAPKSTQSNSYQEYTKERFAEDPNVTFTEIAASWKTMTEAQKKPYQVRAVKINEEAKRELEKYVKSLTDEEQMRFFKSRKLTEKPKARVKKEKKAKGLSQRDFKKAELQYLKEEKKIAIKENPDLEEEEVLKRLSEAFRSLDYETQKSYCRKAEISLQEQKKITEFYKNFESPLAKKKLTSLGTPPSQIKSSLKKDSTTSESSDSSSDAEEEKVSKRKPPVLVLGKKAETDSDSSSEDERSGKPVVQSPVKRKVRDKSSDSDSSSSSSNIKTGTSLNISPKKPVSSRKNVAKVKNVKKESSSSDSDSSSDEEPKTTGRQTGPSLKKAPVNKKPESSSGSSSSEDEANKTQKKHQARSSPTKKVMLNNKMAGMSSPRKATIVKKPETSSSGTSSSEDEANKTQKKTQPLLSPTKKTTSSLKTPTKSPKKLVNSEGKKKLNDDGSSDMSDVLPLTQSSSPKKSAKRPPPPSSSSSDLSSSDSSSESDDGKTGSQKQSGLSKTPQHTLKTSLNTSMKSISTPSSLKTLKKKQK